MLDWIFEGIIDWVARTVTSVMDAVSGLFLNALGTDMTAMAEYFPFVSEAFTIMQYTAWALLFLIVVWQLFKTFGGPITEGEEPWGLVLKGGLFALLIYFAKPIFLYVLEIARAPYTALMDITLSKEAFSFAGVENVLKAGLVQYVSNMSVVGAILQIILLIALGWNYFKLLLEVVERYVVVGILCYTSPLAYSMGASKSTSQVFKSWSRMVGSQLLLLVMTVWFLRAFNTSVAQYCVNGGALSNGRGNVFLWLFCAIAFLKTAQRFDSYLASIGLNVAQTGTGMGMELLMAARVVTGLGSGFKSAGSVFKGAGGGAGGAAGAGFAAGFADKFKGNSFVRDSVVQGGTRMGAGGSIGFVGRIFGGMAARNGATLTGNSISSVASRTPDVSGRIAGDIADRSLSNYLPHLNGTQLSGTQINGGHISTTAIGSNGQSASVELYNAAQFERPSGPHSVVDASDGTQWYQIASGAGAGAFYNTPNFTGDASEASRVAEAFPGAAEGTMLRTVEDGVIAASTPEGETVWYNSGYYEEPKAPHSVMQGADGVDWYAMNPHAEIPPFEAGADAAAYNQSQFHSFMPGYENPSTSVDGSMSDQGQFEVRHDDGSGTRFYDSSQYSVPRGDYQTYEDANGHQWYGIHGDAAVERRPVYENGQPVYDGDNVRTVNVESVRYKSTPARYGEPEARDLSDERAPSRRKI